MHRARPASCPLSRDWFDRQRRAGRIAALIVLAMLFALLVSGCAGNPEPGPLPASVAAAPRSADLRPMLATPSLLGVVAALGLAQPMVGTVRLVTGESSCQCAGGTLPYPVLPREIPRAGREVQITWATRACPIPAPPAAPCWLVASFSPPHPVPFGAYGTPGCWLLTEPDQLVAVPTTRAPGGLCWREGGHVFFRWTPGASDVGTRLVMQLVVAAPGENRAGWLISPAVELIVGS